jgi:hypothetical protein
MRACGDQIGNGATRIATGDQTLTDEHGVGARTRIGKEIVGATNTGFGDPDDV